MVYEVRGENAPGSTYTTSLKVNKVERYKLKMPQRDDITTSTTSVAKATAAY